MHHLLHTAAVILFLWTFIVFLIGLVPGILIGRKTKR